MGGSDTINPLGDCADGDYFDYDRYLTDMGQRMAESQQDAGLSAAPYNEQPSIHQQSSGFGSQTLLNQQHGNNHHGMGYPGLVHDSFQGKNTYAPTINGTPEDGQGGNSSLTNVNQQIYNIFAQSTFPTMNNMTPTGPPRYPLAMPPYYGWVENSDHLNHGNHSLSAHSGAFDGTQGPMDLMQGLSASGNRQVNSINDVQAPILARMGDGTQGKQTPKKQGGRQLGSVNKKKSPEGSNKAQTPSKSNTYKFDPEPKVLTYGERIPYWTDHSLDSASACRDYLAHPHHVHKFEIPGDDWQDVRDNHLHEYIGKIYNNLLHPHSNSGPVIKHLGNDAEGGKRKRYNESQIKATENIGILLGAVDGEECAKRQCRLLVEAVLNFHSLGTAYVTWEGYEWYDEKGRTKDRIYRLELSMICSKRLEMIADVVKANKLIAEDVAQGLNFNRLANDPEFCHEHKVTLSKSNSTRQSKTDGLNAKFEEKVKKGMALEEEPDDQDTPAAVRRRKEQPKLMSKLNAKREAEASSDSEEGDSDGSYHPPASNKHRRRQ